MKRKEFWINLPDETYTQKEGYQVSTYHFVWRSEKRTKWILSHLPTGAGIKYDFETVKDARVYAERIVAMNSIPWSSTDLGDFKNTCDLQGYMDKVGGGKMSAEDADVEILTNQLLNE